MKVDFNTYRNYNSAIRQRQADRQVAMPTFGEGGDEVGMVVNRNCDVNTPSGTKTMFTVTEFTPDGKPKRGVITFLKEIAQTLSDYWSGANAKNLKL